MAIVNSRAAIESKTGKAAIFVNETIPSLMRKLFSNGEQGFFYDPNDLTTMFQDAVGTVPVTGAGQPVGLIRDKSGRNNHARQTTSASRPILRQNAVTGANYLEFDGRDDYLQTNNIDFTTTDKVSLFAGVRKLSDAASAIIVESSSSADVSNGAFNMMAPAVGGPEKFRVGSRGTVFSFIATYDAKYTAPYSAIMTAICDIAAPSIELRINSVVAGQTVTSQGVGNYGNYPLYIGRRATIGALAFNGHLYGLIGIGKLTSDSETAAIEKELAKRVGVALNV